MPTLLRNIDAVLRPRGCWRAATIAAALAASACAGVYPPLDPPHVTLADLRVRDMTLFEQRYAVKLRVQNPNPVELPITGLEFALYLNDVEFARGVSRDAVTVPAYGEALTEVELVSSLMRLFEQVRGLERGEPQGLRYRLAGGVSLASRAGKIPFEYRGEIGPHPR